MSVGEQMPSFAFHDGVLHIGAHMVQMRIRWDPEPLAEELLSATRKWQPFWPDFRLVRPVEPRPHMDAVTVDMPVNADLNLPQDAKNAAFAAFRNQIPPHIVRLTEPFGSHQWLLLLLLRLKQEACDLAENSPVLAYCLANHPGFRNTIRETAVWHAAMHCTLKQRTILEWLGFPSNEATVRLFRKIYPESASPFMMRLLRHALTTEPRVGELLSHQRTVNAGVLGLVTNLHLLGIISSKLLLEVAANPDDMILARTLDQVVTGAALLREAKRKLPTTPLTTLAQVRSFQENSDKAFRDHLIAEEACRERERQELARREVARQQRAAERRANAAARMERRVMRLELAARKPFPPPPVPGTQGIVPLTSPRELLQEGAEQRNCVAGYASLVVTGRLYVYRVLEPARATLSIQRGADGAWRRSELASKGNQTVPSAVVRYVDQWLRGHSISV